MSQQLGKPSACVVRIENMTLYVTVPTTWQEEVGEKRGRLELILFMMPGKLGKNGSSLISRERAGMKYAFMKVKKYAKPFVPSKSFAVLKRR